MTRIYARTNTVPDGCDYITPGKLYEVKDHSGGFFWMEDDEGDGLVCLWEDCANLRGGNWERVEIDDEPAPSRYTLMTVTELEAEISAAECALAAKRAMDTLLQIDGELYD